MDDCHNCCGVLLLSSDWHQVQPHYAEHFGLSTDDHLSIDHDGNLTPCLQNAGMSEGQEWGNHLESRGETAYGKTESGSGQVADREIEIWDNSGEIENGTGSLSDDDHLSPCYDGDDCCLRNDRWCHSDDHQSCFESDGRSCF